VVVDRPRECVHPLRQVQQVCQGPAQRDRLDADRQHRPASLHGEPDLARDML
jgi:hypothetical protein